MKKYLIILTTVFIFFVLLFYFPNNSKTINSVQIAGQNIKAILALTEGEQIKGLSGRDKLEDDEGMLFVFDQIGKHNFWMKDMNFPIDIIWLGPVRPHDNLGTGGEDLKVVYIKENAHPKTYPETFGPNVDTKYVLEVMAGFSNKNNLKIGDSVLFKY